MKRLDNITQSHFDNLENPDKQIQLDAFNKIITATEVEVEWAYDVWDQLLVWLTDKDNHKRSRAAQFLARLAISDPEKRMSNDFSKLWKVTKDSKFVTARHSLQAIWRVGLAGEEQKGLVLNHIENRFRSGADEKHYTLIRFDMIQGMKNLYDVTKDEDIKRRALDLINEEEDLKYRKKYMSLWK